MNTLSELRAALKPLGFGVKTKSLSWGKHAVYFRLSDKKELAGNVFTPETLAPWSPLFSFLIENKETVKALGQQLKVYGLTK